MISNISFPDFGMAVLIALTIGLVYAFGLYWKDRKFLEISRPLTYFLAFLRGFLVTLILLLLFSPLIKSTKEDIKQPVIVMAQDVSQSIAENMTSEALNTYNQGWNDVSTALKTKYDVHTLNFSTEVNEGIRDTFDGQSTNLSKTFEYINSNFGDQNLGAIILSSDGIYNEGSNPLYMEMSTKKPLYVVAMGDTTQRKDLYISEVFHNKIAYLGDKFTIQVDVKAFNAQGQNSKLVLESSYNGVTKKILEENISINKEDFFTQKVLTVDAAVPGIIKYRFSLTPINGEANKVNNVKEFYIEILDGRQKILLLANAPHPDIAAFRQIILSNKNYEVTTAMVAEDVVDVSKYDLVVLHNLPSDKNPINDVLNVLNRKGTPRLFVVGMQTALPLFNQAQDILKISGNSKNTEDIQTEINPNFNAFLSSDLLKQKVRNFPPLLVPFGDYGALGNSSVFMTQIVKKIKTNYPQLIFGETKGIKSAVFCGEGLWKWRMNDYAQHTNYDLVSEIVNKSIQWASVKDDKRKFRISTSKNLYKENESVLFEAQLYNDNYEMTNEPDVALSVKHEDGNEYKYTFSKNSNYYTLNAGLFAPGSYSYTGTVNFGGRIQTASGKFNVESIQLEQYDVTARHFLLQGLVDKMGGKLIYPNELKSLSEILVNDQQLKPVMYQSTTTKSIIHIKWIFFLLLFLLTLEWFLRRYFGSY